MNALKNSLVFASNVFADNLLFSSSLIHEYYSKQKKKLERIQKIIVKEIKQRKI